MQCEGERKGVTVSLRSIGPSRAVMQRTLPTCSTIRSTALPSHFGRIVPVFRCWPSLTRDPIGWSGVSGLFGLSGLSGLSGSFGLARFTLHIFSGLSGL